MLNSQWGSHRIQDGVLTAYRELQFEAELTTVPAMPTCCSFPRKIMLILSSSRNPQNRGSSEQSQAFSASGWGGGGGGKYCNELNDATFPTQA
jgi:hypothetical protein